MVFKTIIDIGSFGCGYICGRGRYSVAAFLRGYTSDAAPSDTLDQGIGLNNGEECVMCEAGMLRYKQREAHLRAYGSQILLLRIKRIGMSPLL